MPSETRKQLTTVDISHYSSVIDTFRERLKLRNLSERTLLNYVSCLILFFAWCVLNLDSKPASLLDYADFRQFLVFLDQEKLAPRTVNVYIATFRQFLYFIQQRDWNRYELPYRKYDRMHFLFVPVIEDKKWNAKNPDKPPRVKVCAKELIDKIEMSVFHPELQKFLDSHSEKNLYPVLNGTTIGGNRTIAELKAQTALEEAADATRQAQAVKEAAERTIYEVKEQQKQVQADIESIQEVRQETEADTEKWLEELEEKELPIVQGLRDDLKDMGIAPEGYDDIKNFAKALDNPIKSKTGKTYVEIPNPERTLPIIKKVMNKVIVAIEKTRELTKKVKDQMGKARVSVRAMLKEAQEEARRQNAERKPTGKKKDISR